MDRLRVALVQMAHGPDVTDNLARARAWLEKARAAGADLALLPEYFFARLPGVPLDAAARAGDVRGFYAEASRTLALVVAGNVIEQRGEALLNLGVAYENGRVVLEQPKVHPMPREAAGGVGAGGAFRSASVRGVNTGMLVCADILYPEAARVLALQGAQVLLNPVMSPYRAGDDGKAGREAMFIARAYDSGAFVLKAAGVKMPAGEPPTGVAGRSLVAAPWGMVARYADDLTEELLVADLDLARLAGFRERQAQFPARRPDAYGDLVR